MDHIEARILEQIDAKRGALLSFGEETYRSAETGYEEFNTARRAAQWLRGFGYTVREGLAVTGLRAEIGNGDGPAVAVIGELDGILCPTHPQANAAAGGISHACGHHAQLNAVLGAAAAFADPEVARSIQGRVVFFLVPAEEYVPIERRVRLTAEGKISRCSGKSELLCLGEFDDIDLALTTHVHMVDSAADLLVGNNCSTGSFTKTVRLVGKAAHAAAAPHNGVNALSAATLGLSAIGLIREGFRERDCVRIHTNITHGGDAINVVPANVTVEGMVRAANLDALEAVSAKFDRAFEGTAYAVGAKAETETWQGYLPGPFIPADPAQLLAAETVRAAFGPGFSVEKADAAVQNYASTDVGDLAQVMPVLNFTHSGTRGSLHSSDFAVVDPEKALVMPSKMMALTAYHLLKENAALARGAISRYAPPFTRDEYRGYIRRFK